jgi:hypothetical protein
LPLTSPRDRFRAYALFLLVVAAYLLYARTRTVPQTFFMLLDQIRDWQVALGPLASLPLTGPQSTAGGSSLGPVYYWLLWIIRHALGPWTHNLPHAGAFGIAAFQTAADLLLLEALRRVTGSPALAFAAVILGATASHDLAITATIWNPAVSVAFVKIALAMLLLGREGAAWWWTPAIVVPAWFAVQAHSAALFVAAPVIGARILQDLAARRWIAAVGRIRSAVEVILILQLPFIYHAFTRPGSDVGPTRVFGSALEIVRHPASARLGDSFTALIAATGSILMKPWASSWWWPSLLLIAVIGLILRSGRSLVVMSATVLPLAAAGLGFALWRGAYDEYWYLPLVPCVVLTVTLGLTGGRAGAAAIVLAAVVTAIQPARLAHSLTWYRMPEYGAMSRGALEIRRRTPEIRRIDTAFAVPPLSDRYFLYRVLGGQVRADAAFDAVIDVDGKVRFLPVR